MDSTSRPARRPPNKSLTKTRATRDLLAAYRDESDVDSPASRRQAQMLANNAPQVRLTGIVNDKGHFEVQYPPEGLDAALWSAVRICLERLSKQDTHKTSPDPGVIVLRGDTVAATGYLLAVNATINLLQQLGLSPKKVTRVLTEFPGVVSLLHVNGPKRFTLTGTAGGRPQIASITTTVIVQIAATLAEAGQPAACCKLLVACGTKEKHLKGLLLEGYAAAFAHWPSSREDELLKKLAEVGKGLRREAPHTWRDLVSSRALPQSIRAVLWPEMAENIHAKGAREAAVELLSSWVSASLGSPDTRENILCVQLGEDGMDGMAMPRLLDLARVLADQSLVLADKTLNQALMEYRDDFAAALTQVAHATLRTGWVDGEAGVLDLLKESLTEIPNANEGDLPRSLWPLVQCLKIGVILDEAVALAIWVPMLDDVGKHTWREAGPALAALREEIVAELWQVEAQFPDLEVATVQATLRSFGTTLREGHEVPSTPEAILPPASDAVLERRLGCAELAQKLNQLEKDLSELSLPKDKELLDCIKLIKSNSELLPHLIGGREEIERAMKAMDAEGQRRIVSLLRSGGLLDPAPEIDRARQQKILNALLQSVACRDFLRWMAEKAGYAAVRDVMLSLLGPTLHVKPATLHEMLIAQPEDLRFALAVALSPLVSTLVPDESAPALAELLLKQWSRRADVFTLLFEACVGSKKHYDTNDWGPMMQVFAAPSMYVPLMDAAAREHVLDRSPAHLQQCIGQFLDGRMGENKYSRRFQLSVLADCALRCVSNVKVFEDGIDRLSREADVLYRGDLERGGGNIVFDALNGGGADRWRRMRFTILTSTFPLPLGKV